MRSLTTYPAMRRPIMTALAALVLLLSGCALGPETAAPKLTVAADAPVWPLPPEQPRYAYVGTLLGERDFLAPGHDEVRGLGTALKWLVGLVIGEPRYIELQRPVSGMTDEQGHVYVIDASHRAVMVFDMTQKRLRRWTLAAKGLPFLSPVAIVGDGRGGFLVSDAELAEVFRLDAEGRPTGRFGQGILTRPTGLTRDGQSGLVYVSDTARHDIKVFDDEGNLVELFGHRGNSAGTFNTPTHLAFQDGRLYIADTLNFRVQVFDRAGEDRLVFGRLGLFVGNMSRPKGVTTGGDGRIYVVESYFDHLLVYNRSGELLLPIGGTGQGVGEFYLPSGVWTDPTGRVYIADMFNGRVVVFQELTGEAPL